MSKNNNMEEIHIKVGYIDDYEEDIKDGNTVFYITSTDDVDYEIEFDDDVIALSVANDAVIADVPIEYATTYEEALEILASNGVFIEEE